MHLTVRKGASKLQKSVSQGTFAVVDVSNDAKIADVLHSSHSVLLI
jgi:hypothetical protein